MTDTDHLRAALAAIARRTQHPSSPELSAIHWIARRALAGPAPSRPGTLPPVPPPTPEEREAVMEARAAAEVRRGVERKGAPSRPSGTVHRPRTEGTPEMAAPPGTPVVLEGTVRYVGRCPHWTASCRFALGRTDIAASAWGLARFSLFTAALTGPGDEVAPHVIPATTR